MKYELKEVKKPFLGVIFLTIWNLKQDGPVLPQR